ncbi:MAG: M23 family metallopeptidase [Candidatus Roizmanbacteria bacterium]
MTYKSEFLTFLGKYIVTRVLFFATRFGYIKRFLTGSLIQDRGKYSSHIVNASFIFLLMLIVISAPTIAQNHPLGQSEDIRTISQTSLTQAEIFLDEQDISVNTIRAGGLRDKVISYQTVKGDTLESIAKKFDVSTKTITWANTDLGATPKVGTIVKIAPVSGVVHHVEPGENIYLVAKKYGIDAQNIVNFPFNEFKDDAFTLIGGSDLVIPGGSIAEPKQPIFADTYVFAQVQAGVKGSSSFIWPTNGIITQYPASYHMALDIANPSQPPVIAADTGTVIYSGCFSWGYGCHIIIDHNNGYRSLYGHLSRRDVEQGATVSQGQQIGTMGSTGRSTGTHLHFEIRQGSTLLNPQNFLK